jgi:hypothetical protein
MNEMTNMKDENVENVREPARACSKVVSQTSYSVLETAESFYINL